MATTFRKLGDLQKRIEDRQDREKAVWFSTMLKDSKRGKLKVRFLQEISDEAELYDAAKGTFLGAVEHTGVGPKGFTSKALDTMESEGHDWAQEQHELCNRLGWGPKENFYINVAVEDFDEEGEKIVVPAILARPIGSDFVQQLITRHNESNGVGISDKTFWITKTGQGPQTKWNLELETDPGKQIDVSGVEIYDLEKTAVLHVPYEKQRAFYMRTSDVDYAYKAAAKRAADKNGTSVEEELEKLGYTPSDDRDVPPRDRSEDEGSSAPAGAGKPKFKW
jgi:hypothetical protein